MPKKIKGGGGVIINSSREGVHDHIIGRVALERFAAMVIFLTVVCKVYAKENKGGGQKI